MLYKGHKVVGIDREAKTVTSEHGEVVSYDKLIIATGSNPFIIPVPGKDLPGVLTYRDLDDVKAMLLAAQSRDKAVVIGGGLLGLEAAAGLKARDMDVTVVHLMPTLMERQLDPAAGYLLQRELEARGIKVITKANTKAILGDARVEGVELADGTVIPATLVVMAVGIRPNADLAKEAGLEVNRGIVVDDGMRTSDPDIYALGECAEVGGQVYGLVAPLYEMARVAAAQLAGDAARQIRPCRHADQAEGHRHRPLFARRLRRGRGPRGDRAARRDGGHLQASRHQGQPNHRHGALRRDRRRCLVQRPEEEAHRHLGHARDADLRPGLSGRRSAGPYGGRCSLAG